MTTIQLYLIIGLLVVFGIVGGYGAYKIISLSADNTKLTSDNVILTDNAKKLTDAVTTNEATIAYQKTQADQQATAQVALSKAVNDAEATSFEKTATIKDKDLISSSNSDPDTTETEINADFFNINQALIDATTPSVPTSK